jgi:hypothetical protein
MWQVGRLAILGGFLVLLQAVLPGAHLVWAGHHSHAAAAATVDRSLQPAPSEGDACGLCLFFQGVGPLVVPEPPPQVAARVVPVAGIAGLRPIGAVRPPPDVRSGSPRGPPI